MLQYVNLPVFQIRIRVLGIQSDGELNLMVVKFYWGLLIKLWCPRNADNNTDYYSFIS
jgi:hypothetical protein